MKTLNTLELDHLIEAIEFLEGAEFQVVLGLEDVITLKLWKEGPLWLSFNLSRNTPLLLASKKEPLLDPTLLKKALKKPLNIFLTTHFKGLSLTKVERLKKYGRVLRFYFDGREDLYLEFRAYPGGLNLIAVNKNKSVAWAKPIALEESDEDYEPEMVRSPAVALEEGAEFLNFTQKKRVSTNSKAKEDMARTKIEEGVLFLKSDGYKRFSDILSEGGDLPEDLKGYYRDKLSLRENIDWGYEQQKLKDTKLQRLEDRLKTLKLSLKSEDGKKQAVAKTSNSASKEGRFFQISEKVKAFCGKSAKENISLLRRAKSWHLWMHLKDYPSGHLILDIPKSYDYSENELEKAALFLFSVAAPRKLHSSDKIKFEIIFTESKFVKPIKGAKLGLVQPSRTRSRLYEWNKKNQVTY